VGRYGLNAYGSGQGPLTGSCFNTVTNLQVPQWAEDFLTS